VKDNINVISFSSNASDGVQFNYDFIAITTYKAMECGIFVSVVTDNIELTIGSVGNYAPWMLTVAAGTTDHVIHTIVPSSLLVASEEYAVVCRRPRQPRRS
jgi:hypothetical protein